MSFMLLTLEYKKGKSKKNKQKKVQQVENKQG